MKQLETLQVSCAFGLDAARELLLLRRSTDWVELPIVDILTRVVAKTSNRVMFGEELGRCPSL